MADTLTPELQKARKEVYNYYKYNPLMNLPFEPAAWSLLTFAEDRTLKDLSSAPTAQDREMIVDLLVNDLKYPMQWLYRHCKGDQDKGDQDKVDRASRDLLRLGKKCQSFVSAFRYAEDGWIELELKGSTIQPTENLFTGMEYEAYNRLIKPHKSQEASSSVNPDDRLSLREAIRPSLRVDGNRLKYKLNPKMVSDTITAFVRPILDGAFSLPSDWQFNRYSLGDFRKVFEAISAMAFIHTIARKMARDQGYECYADSISVKNCDELLKRVVRYSGVSESEVRSIFDDLSYGNRCQKNPDPVLQPLIKLNSEVYAIMPHLWLCSSPERNLTVLLNRLPSEKKIYSKLVDEKEDLMRERFTAGLPAQGFRSIKGRVPDLPPDIDLAIISDSEKACLLLEFKWFIEPAEAVEVIRRSKMIKKGISQLTQLKEAFASNYAPLLKKLNIDSSYRLEGVVVSENWVGHGTVQSPEIPVIQANHLIAKLSATDSLKSVMEWLKARKYLPTEGEHFEVHRFNATIGNWRVKWYGIQLLPSNSFFPL